MGHAWESPPGNLYASTLVEVRAGDPLAPTLGFVAAAALFGSFAHFANPTRLRLKWPNDVLGVTATGVLAKLSGILLERTGDSIVVGIGANLVDHPLTLDRPATSLHLLVEAAPDRDRFLEVLAAQLVHWLEIWRNGGVAVVREAWLANAHPPGTPLSVSLPDGERIDAEFAGLGDDCSLRLRLADGAVRVIHAGDVFLV